MPKHTNLAAVYRITSELKIIREYTHAYIRVAKSQKRDTPILHRTTHSKANDFPSYQSLRTQSERIVQIFMHEHGHALFVAIAKRSRGARFTAFKSRKATTTPFFRIFKIFKTLSSTARKNFLILTVIDYPEPNERE